MRPGQLGLARVQLMPYERLVPGQSQLMQQRQACLQVAEGVPGLTKGQMAVRYLEQAQGVRALGTLGAESLGGLPVGLDSRLVTAQAIVAIAEQVEEVGLVTRWPAGRPAPRTPQAFLHNH